MVPHLNQVRLKQSIIAGFFGKLVEQFLASLKAGRTKPHAIAGALDRDFI
ncbi:MAG: hypothetical protein HC856_11250 [Pseudanabaena sp. RU_4_16]|nr:hypothetical protein [Pseudanabaena sp. RU_4_16]